jgi:hypothetical protein
MTDIDDIKKLPPEERLKKLRELEENRKKEIAEAQKMMKLSEDELKQMEQLKEKVPIPQLESAEDADMSEEEKSMFRMQRFKGKGESKEIDEEKAKKGEEESLEETVAREKVQHAPKQVDYGQAIQEASMRPAHEFYQEMAQISSAAQERGYVSREEMSRVAYIDAATELKEGSDYSPGDKTMKEMSLVHEMKSKLQDMYKTQSTGSALQDQKHEYSEFTDNKENYSPQ